MMTIYIHLTCKRVSLACIFVSVSTKAMAVT